MAISRRLRFEILKRDGHTCRYCGATAPDVKLTVDHVNPTALGGSDQPDNLVTACASCNGGKSSVPPGADLVADVTGDAIRWSAAIRTAADQMLSDLNQRETPRKEFDEAWSAWGAGTGDKRVLVPRPNGWEQSIDSFMAAGLPMPILLEAMQAAMSNQKLRIDDIFRYMCGIAWKRVAELQESAKGILGAGPDDLPGPPPGADYEAMYNALAMEIFGYFRGVASTDDVKVMADLDIRGREEDEDPIAFTNEGHAALAVAAAASSMLSNSITGARQLFGTIPDALIEELRRDAVWTLLTADKVEEALLDVDGGYLWREMVIARMVHQATQWIDFSGVRSTPEAEGDS